MKSERRDARAALDRYQAAVKPTPSLVLDLMQTISKMIDVDTDHDVAFVIDGITYRVSESMHPAFKPKLQVVAVGR